MEDYPETEHRSRERAIWFDEVPPEEERYATREAGFAAEPVVEPEPQQAVEPQPEPEHEEVWLAGPPPEDFHEYATPVITRNRPPEQPFEPEFVPVAYVPDTPAETVRRSGLAYSAGIVFFASVAFMLLLGWGADLLLGSSPWGLVGGIVLGSIIGFVQFFRISSQIFSPKNDIHPLLSRDDDPEPPSQL